MVDGERIRTGMIFYGSGHCFEFPTVFLIPLVGWQEERLVHKKPCAIYPQRSLPVEMKEENQG